MDAPPLGTDAKQPSLEIGKVSILPISQATTAKFTDLYFRLTFLFFIKNGSKCVLTPTQGELVGEEGDLMIFPPGSMVTLENRPVLNDAYRALGVCFTHDLVEAAYADSPSGRAVAGVQIVRSSAHRPFDVLSLIQAPWTTMRCPRRSANTVCWNR